MAIGLIYKRPGTNDAFSERVKITLKTTVNLTTVILHFPNLFFVQSVADCVKLLLFLSTQS